MLLNTEKPGWLGEVLDGATTIWENWEGNVSQNHYSPGAVCQWLFDTCAGIRVDGENHFVIAPQPGGALSHAEASYRSLYGVVKSRWERTDGGLKFRVEIPPDGSIPQVEITSCGLNGGALTGQSAGFLSKSALLWHVAPKKSFS